MTDQEIAEQDPIRRLTNQQLWEGLIGWTPESEFTPTAIELELERRLRRIGFLPALPLQEEP